jgi:pimeloyl-ACP methyl ester carboxylesterase
MGTPGAAGHRAVEASPRSRRPWLAMGVRPEVADVRAARETGRPCRAPSVGPHGHAELSASVPAERGRRRRAWPAADQLRPAGSRGSTPQPGRNIADCADDIRAICTELGIDRRAMWGVSGGGPHVLACTALLPALVVAAAALASPAPYGAEGLTGSRTSARTRSSTPVLADRL